MSRERNPAAAEAFKRLVKTTTTKIVRNKDRTIVVVVSDRHSTSTLQVRVLTDTSGAFTGIRSTSQDQRFIFCCCTIDWKYKSVGEQTFDKSSIPYISCRQ